MPLRGAAGSLSAAAGATLQPAAAFRAGLHRMRAAQRRAARAGARLLGSTLAPRAQPGAEAAACALLSAPRAGAMPATAFAPRLLAPAPHARSAGAWHASPALPRRGAALVAAGAARDAGMHAAAASALLQANDAPAAPSAAPPLLPVPSAADDSVYDAPSPASPAEASAPTQRPVTRRRTVSADDKELLSLPGVGHVNAERLKAHGHHTVNSLREYYERTLALERERLVTHLRKTVGVRSRVHAEAIATRLDELRAREEPGSGAGGGSGGGRDAARQRLTICVEGNISAGKTTFLQRIIGGSDAQKTKFHLVPEPVERWTAIPSMAETMSGTAGADVAAGLAAGAAAAAGGASGDAAAAAAAAAAGLATPPAPSQSDDAADAEYNILGAFYKDPARWGYTFQNWVFFTRFMQERASAHPQQEELRGLHRLMERSVFSDRLVFVEALKDNSQLTQMEMAIYRNWFEFMMEDKPQLVPDAFIYLRAQASTCYDRMRRRARSEEGGVPLDYLEVLHSKHEGWFLPQALNKPRGILDLSRGARAHAQHGFVVDQSSELRRMVQQFPHQRGLSEAVWSKLTTEVADAVHDKMPASIRGCVVFLPASAAGRPLHERAMSRIPALVLDVDGSMDVANDVAAREAVATKVSDFYEFVGDMKRSLFGVLGAPGRVTPQDADAAAFRAAIQRVSSLERIGGGVLQYARR